MKFEGGKKGGFKKSEGYKGYKARCNYAKACAAKSFGSFLFVRGVSLFLWVKTKKAACAKFAS